LLGRAEKDHEKHVRTAGILAKILTEYVLDTSQMC
jgi:hypothetical protein